MVSCRTSRLLLVAVCGVFGPGAGAAAQSWSLVGPAPGVSFGLAGDLIARDAQGLVGFDEAAARTVLPYQGGFVHTPAAAPARLFATLAGNQSRAYLFGGLDSTTGQPRSDVWRFDRSTVDWSPVPTTPGGPGPRVGAKAAPWQDGWPLVFFGGTDLVGMPNDTWLLMDLGAVTFWISQPTPPGLAGRIQHTMAQAPRAMVILFGGSNGGVLGDCWLWNGTAWQQHLGPSPPPAVDARMAYDAARDMTVMLHPNGQTWEWNGFTWRLVGATGAPSWLQPAAVWEPGVGSGSGRVLGIEAGSVRAFAPSPARFDVTLDATCAPPGGQPLELDAFERSLPILGQAMVLRARGLLPTALLFGAFELSSQPTFPLGCGCQLGLNGIATGVQFVPGTTSARLWSLPIANDPALYGAAIDVQGIVLDPASVCFVTSTQRGTIVCGL